MEEEKLALVVDDSKSARLVLKRMLERHQLRVDTVASATEALDFLLHNRPDVIFMDHMMPGMDGFEAVKAIKENPATATIPILMYTSKGGDLYLGQARALGAVGILPKTVAPAELFDSLQQLGLVKERRTNAEPDTNDDGEIASERKEDIPRRPHPPVPFFEPGMSRTGNSLDTNQLDEHVRKLLEEQRVELRKDLLVSMESVARQTAGKINREVDEQLQLLKAAPAPRDSGSWPMLTLLLALLLLVSLGWNWSLQPHSVPEEKTAAAALPAPQSSDETGIDQNKLELQLEHTRQQLQRSHQNLVWGINRSMLYSYDEIALDNQRVDAIQALLERLAGSGFAGTVTLATHVGEFCLSGNQQDGYRLPPPDLSVDQCEFIGNPVQPSDRPATHQSLRFANFSSSVAELTQGNIDLEVIVIPREEVLYDYPEKSAVTRAGTWNEAASQNNRVQISITP